MKYDIRHFLSNLFLMATTKDSSFFKYFCVAVSDAIFKIIPESRDEVHAHLLFIGMAEEDIKRVSRKYWRTRARYIVLAPAEIARDLTDVYNFFKDLVDASTNRTFFNADHARRFKNEMIYVQKGCLSDIPGLPMYLKTGRTKADSVSTCA